MARQLALGARLDAVITAAAPKGKILIDTAYGRVAIQTGFPLPKDGALQLQLQAKGGSFQFLITAIYGMPPKTALRALGLIPSAAGKSSGAPSPAVVTGNATPPNLSGPVTRLPSAVNLTIGATIAATLFKPSPPTAMPAADGSAQGATAQPGQSPLSLPPAKGNRLPHPDKRHQRSLLPAPYRRADPVLRPREYRQPRNPGHKSAPAPPPHLFSQARCFPSALLPFNRQQERQR